MSENEKPIKTPIHLDGLHMYCTRLPDSSRPHIVILCRKDEEIVADKVVTIEEVDMIIGMCLEIKSQYVNFVQADS